VSKLEETLNRIAVACERMAEDPVIQMETGPPACPHCDRINPVIKVEESGGTGLMAEFVIQAKCEHCGKVFYALPVQYHIATRVSQIPEMLEARKEIAGYGNNGTEQ
jgi:hypothetical protein